MRKGRRQKLKSFELDWVGSWRRFYRWSAGASREAKNSMQRRFRRSEKSEIAQGLSDAEEIERRDTYEDFLADMGMTDSEYFDYCMKMENNEDDRP